MSGIKHRPSSKKFEYMKNQHKASIAISVVIIWTTGYTEDKQSRR
jgi:hypothetical protein